MRYLGLTTAVVLTSIAHLARGFTAPPRRAFNLPSKRVAGNHQEGKQAAPTTANLPIQRSSTKLCLVNAAILVLSPEVLGPAVLLVASAVATIVTTTKNEGALLDKPLEPTAPSPPPTPPVAVEEEAEGFEAVPEPISVEPSASVPAPAPAPPAIAPVDEDVEIEPTPLPDSIAYSEEDVAVQLDPSIARTGRASTGISPDVAAFAETSSNPTSAGDSIAELRRGVAKTLDEGSTVPQTQLLQRTEIKADNEADAVPSDEEEEKRFFLGLFKRGSGTTTKAAEKKSLLRRIFRVVKKIVAPWRKWENIQ